MSSETALIIGQGTMPVACANRLVREGIKVLGVSSPDDPLRTWAESNRVPHLGELGEFTELARSMSFDDLFSIVNYRVLPKALLDAPRHLAINYHDAPLPKYAGVHATTWAILNGEDTHGITWHIMIDKVDAGDILKQVCFPIEPSDTAHQLNLMCYYTGIEAFAELVTELRNDEVTPIPQDLSQRTYFGVRKRPDNDCLISFDWPAKQIEAFCRALDFESAPNAIGRPRLVIGGRTLIVPRVVRTDSISGALPGTVVAVSGESIQVATSTEDIQIPMVLAAGGRRLAIGESENYGLVAGSSCKIQESSTLSLREQT